jgi:release factor glutamine methyltransferase
MFVQSNTLAAIKNYFSERLYSDFSESELKLMFQTVVEKRLNLSKADLILQHEIRLSESDLLHFRSVVKRLQTQEPFQYIVGSTEFYGLELTCDKRALIPRPETEELVDWITTQFEHEAKLHFLDLCTGSGCIALALKSIFQNSTVIGVDKSQPALELATENKNRTKLAVEFSKMNVLRSSDYSFSPASFECWVSNPPYIPKKERVMMAQNVLDFEPEMALFVSDEDPLIFYREIAKNGLIYLKSGGKLFFELHENLTKETCDLLQKMGYKSIEVKKDLQGKERMLCATKN